jgi:L-alanine-DL-glutamate epimerase-like enolase superfamily enzyme
VDLLGGRASGPVPIASSVSTGTPEDMLGIIKDYRATGYCVHSAKVGADVALDIERIEYLHANRADGETIFFDVNRAWLPNDAITVMNAVRKLPVWFEQPCETLDECKQVRNQTNHPICIDESLHGYSDLLRIHRESIAEIVNIKINRVGGLSKAKRIRDFCVETGLAMLIMETGGTVLADTVAAHLAQSIPAERMLGTWLCHELLSHDMAPGAGARNCQGYTAAPDVPGIGVAPDAISLGEPVAIYE